MDWTLTHSCGVGGLGGGELLVGLGEGLGDVVDGDGLGFGLVLGFLLVVGDGLTLGFVLAVGDGVALGLLLVVGDGLALALLRFLLALGVLLGVSRGVKVALALAVPSAGLATSDADIAAADGDAPSRASFGTVEQAVLTIGELC